MAVFPERRRRARDFGPTASITSIDSDASVLDRAVAADLLLRHLFVPPAQRIEGIDYAAIYRFAEKHSGGDVIDLYQCHGGSVCFSLTDISGKGVEAALHAGLVKYGIRAFASESHRPRDVLRSLNRFYCENDTFEGTDSFASVFFGRFDPDDCTLTYASAGHEGVIAASPRGDMRVLPITGPLIGVFKDEPNLYAEEEIKMERSGLLLAVSDGVTDARTPEEFHGLEPLFRALESYTDGSMEDLCCAVARNAVKFSGNRVIDDIAVLAIRFL